MTIEDRIRLTYSKASEEEIILGKDWFFVGHSFCQELALKYNKTVLQTSAIVSALSPLKEWAQNKELAEQYLRGKRYGHFGTQIEKCRKLENEKCYLNAKAILRGLKTQNFFDALLHPDNQYSVTVDRHICKIATGEHIHTVGNKMYGTIKQAYLNVAKELNLTGNSLQAITWTSYRVENKYKRL